MSADAFAILDSDEREALVQAPHPARLDAMLARLYSEPPTKGDWLFEPKLDGVRVLVHRDGDDVRVWTRNHKDRNGHFPEVVEAVAALDIDDMVIDGEVVAMSHGRSSFARLQGRSGIDDPEAARASGIAIHCYVFDLLHLAAHDTRRLPLQARKRLLREAIAFTDPLRFTPHRRGDGQALLRDACERRWEGLLAKRVGSVYVGKRTADWRKLKCVARQEFVVGGFTDPEGARTGLGALLVGYYSGDTFVFAGKVGTGFDQDTLEQLRSRLDELERPTPPFDDPPRERGVHWAEPALVAEIAFTEWTDDGKLRHPRFEGLRADKDAREVVREA